MFKEYYLYDYTSFKYKIQVSKYLLYVKLSNKNLLEIDQIRTSWAKFYELEKLIEDDFKNRKGKLFYKY